ncbi:tyrosine-type recombinase/integrase [Rubripirellula reticaptiva]|uniref:Site-specific tyrosine recombinase XerC n=1 Tax=Rubripirellula reticaptiva TaxID=2528013 RepID=A0A5C6FDK6_9BACT|nr:site-specific integrase [Rubripirellula reticaptiva]TWU57681.1 site-specific tyrosine recombinase XerC [Rubripirellula reticaptiva]
MPILTSASPKYRKHKASGQAVVTIAGKDHYLGKYGSKPSRMLYDRLVGEWLASGRQPPPVDPLALTITELIARYWKHAKAFYRRADGTSTETAENMRKTLRTLRQAYGNVAVDEFGPIALKAVRQKFVEQGHTRGYVNSNVDKIRRMFRWGVSEELVNESTLRSLQSVTGLSKGKTKAPDNSPVPPVNDDTVDRTLPELPPTVADMVRIQRLTGARPGEVCIIRPSDIDCTGDVWLFFPSRHKTEHHDKQRTIVVGPKAQAILTNYLDREPSAYCFDPREVIDAHLVQRHAKRVTPMSCGCKPGKRKRRRNRAPGDHYTNDSYRRVIHRACDRVFLPPAPLRRMPKESDAARARRLTERQRSELAKWQSDNRWSPNQLRHTMGTLTRERFGIEAVAAVLGHSKTDTSEIYALRNLKLAAEVAMELG